jgi:hypothetical protein
VLNLLVIETRTSTLAPQTPLLDLAMLVLKVESQVLEVVEVVLELSS